MPTTFRDLGVPARMADSLADAGIAAPFPVQEVTLPDALAGRDLCGRAPTGSGKTLGFGIPLLARVGQASPNRPTGLVLVPTRELAEQVQRAFVPLGRAAWRFIQAIYGGAPMGPQIHSLRKGASVLVATPGRLLDLIEQGHCDLGAVEVLVIDEADRMADLGFMPDVRRILGMTPDTRQTMLWSATLDGDVDELIRDFMRDPVRHDLVGEIEHGDVEHRFVVTPATRRLDDAVELLAGGRSAVVFVKTRFGVDDVTAALMNAGVRAGSLHGARSQQARQRTLDDFKRGRVQALVATDVAARGIHVDDVDVVIHYDLPDNEKDYLHRSGRTGRAGRDGAVVAFVPTGRVRVARQLVHALGALDVEVTWDPGAEPTQARSPRPAGTDDRTRRSPRPERSWADQDRPARGPRPHGADGAGRYGRTDRSDAGRADRGSGPRPDRHGESRRERHGEPRQDRTGAPRQDRTGAPRQDRTGAPRQDWRGEPRQAARGERPFERREGSGRARDTERTARPGRGPGTPARSSSARHEGAPGRGPSARPDTRPDERPTAARTEVRRSGPAGGFRRSAGR